MKPAIAQADSILQRYEWIDNNLLVGFVDYYVFDDVCMIMHTEVLPAFASKGMGSQLAGKAMEHVAQKEKSIVPICGFFSQYLRKHPQHHSLVSPASLRIFNITP